MVCVIVERLKTLDKPRVKFFYLNKKYEGFVLSIDNVFIELHDTIGDFTKFYKIELLESLEVLS